MLNILVVERRLAGNNGLMGLLGAFNTSVWSETEPLIEKIKKNSYNVIIMGYGLDLLQSIKNADPRAEVFLVGGSAVDEVEAINRGASACLQEPIDLERLKKSIEEIGELALVRRETAELEKQLFERYTFAGVVGKSPRMLDIFNYLRRIAKYYKTATIMGETGVGKEEIAKALHQTSPGSKEPFLVSNCGAMVETLIESELFGYKKGAFTGAVADTPGIFEAAGEGTVFLDEIGDMPLSLQPHLLRVLQGGDFKRVGSTQPLKAKCRVITATNKDLAKEVKDGRFREDLYFRLTALTIHVPPLRERKDDIPLLSRYMLNRFHQRTGKKVLGISMQAQAALMAYDWPGNVRELENLIEHLAILTTEPFLRLEDLPPGIRGRGAAIEKGADVTKTLDQVVKAHIEAVLGQLNGNQSRAAIVLGISRRALLRKIEKHSIKTGRGS